MKDSYYLFLKDSPLRARGIVIKFQQMRTESRTCRRNNPNRCDFPITEKIQNNGTTGTFDKVRERVLISESHSLSDNLFAATACISESIGNIRPLG